ncbi:hypothetical protein ACTXT7_011480 [Hymenolepis weldensis]
MGDNQTITSEVDCQQSELSKFDEEGMRKFMARWEDVIDKNGDNVEECIGKLQRPVKDLHALESDFCEFMNPQVPERDRPAVVDLLAQLCRFVLDMCNVAIVPPSKITQEEFNFNQLFNSGPVGDDNSLPEWLAYLVAGSALSTDFDTKAICLHTVLDLVEVSASIQEWTACATDQQLDENSNDKTNVQPTQTRWDPSDLLLPVLAKEVLNTLASVLDFFPVNKQDLVTAVSLWSFMKDSTYAEDAASLLLRVISVSPNNTFTSTETLVENFFIQQMLSSDPQIRLEAHVSEKKDSGAGKNKSSQMLCTSLVFYTDFIIDVWVFANRWQASDMRRFVLLWRLPRRATITGNGVDRPLGFGGSNGDFLALSSNTSGWRRSAMGLPPITNELTDKTPNFNRCLLILLDSLEDTRLNNALNSSVDELFKAYGLNGTNNGTEDERVLAEIRQTATAWLTSALNSGQAGRVVAPLFATLLHPSTARTSLISIRNRRRRLRMAKKRRNRRRLKQTGEMQMVNRRNTDVDALTDQTKETDGALFSGDESEDADEVYEEFDAELDLEDGDWNDFDDDDEWEEYDRNICALSGGSPSGELHFYVSNEPSETSSKEPDGKRKKRLGVFSKTPILRRKKKGAGGDGAGGAVESDVFNEEYRPVDVMTCLQNSIYRNSDVNGMKDAERISLDRIRRDVIQANGRCRGLLSQLLKPDSDDGETLNSRNLSPFDQLISLPVKVLPIHEHLLVYLHKYDFNQVIYAFTRLRAILKSDAGSLFLLALAASPTMGKKFSSAPSKPKQEVAHFATCEFPKIFGIPLPDLLARHLRCLFAGGCDDFARHATADELRGVFEQRMPSLLDVLLHVCISFHISLVLPDAQSPLDVAANSNVRLIAAEVLQLITEASQTGVDIVGCFNGGSSIKPKTSLSC